jgi:hypothetical protein
MHGRQHTNSKHESLALPLVATKFSKALYMELLARSSKCVGAVSSQCVWRAAVGG